MRVLDQNDEFAQLVVAYVIRGTEGTEAKMHKEVRDEQEAGTRERTRRGRRERQALGAL